MDTLNKAIDIDFLSLIRSLREQRKSARIQYFTDINEFITTTALIKNISEKEGARYISLSSGEEIPITKIVRIDDTPAPGYGKDYFACDC